MLTGAHYELAARWYAIQFGVSLEQARNDINQPENADWLNSALGMALAGQLDHLLDQPTPGGAPAPPPVAPTPQPGTLPPVPPGQERTTPVQGVTTPVQGVTTPAQPPTVTPGQPSAPVQVTPVTTPVQGVTTTVTPMAPEWTPDELAAAFISRVQGIPIEAARLALNTPAYAAIRASLLAAAQKGSLDYLKTAATGSGNSLQPLIDAMTKGNAQSAYSDLAKALITASSGLRGPRDYQQFVQSTSAGRSLIDQLYGSTPRPTFSAPTGPMEPLTIQDIINRLGLGEGGAQAATTPAKNVPLPHQINPAVWDSLGNVGQQLTLGMAEGQGWDADEFTRQLNAARPRGTAKGNASFQYQSPHSFF